MKRPVLAAALLLVMGGAGSSKAAEPTDLDAFLNGYLHAPGHLRYSMAKADLNGDRRDEVIVYVSDDRFCGSGGCLTLILTPASSTYRVVMRATVTNLPVRLLPGRSHGWRDIGVMVQGGGIVKPYEAALRFDGQRYPGNPTVPPAMPLKQIAGKVLLGVDGGR